MSEPMVLAGEELDPFGDAHEVLLTRGYVVRAFEDPKPLDRIAELCHTVLRGHQLDGDLATYHERVRDQETHLKVVATATAAVNGTDLIPRLFRPELPFLTSLLGPDVLIQTSSHLRVGRPREERDSIDLHRDSFYGCSVWHVNCWFPLVPLQPGCGLLLGEGTHVIPSRGIRDKTFPDDFRATVAKGSVAHALGYVYRPRTDDTIESLPPERLSLITPALGCYVLFFGCMVHGGSNTSPATRWTIDTRFSRPDDGSTVRPEYFREFTRGVISRVARQFYGEG